MKEAGLAPARRSPDLEPAGSARPLVLSRVHWVRPELDLKALLLRENQAFYSARECRHVGSLLTPRWREQDSNHRSLSGTLPGPAHARLPNAARTPCLGAVAQELPLHRVHLGDICRDVVVTAAFAGD